MVTLVKEGKPLRNDSTSPGEVCKGYPSYSLHPLDIRCSVPSPRIEANPARCADAPIRGER